MNEEISPSASETWNHRVIRTKDDIHGYLYSVHEIHYDKDKRITGYTENPILALAESSEQLRWLAQQIVRSTEIPILEFNEDHTELIEVKNVSRNVQ